MTNSRLIAIMLGRLKMDVQECIDLYNSMFKEIFGSPIHKFPVTIAAQIQSQFDSRILRQCIARIVGQSKSLGESDLKALTNASSSKVSQKAKEDLIAGVAAKVLLDDGVSRGCHTQVHQSQGFLKTLLILTQVRVCNYDGGPTYRSLQGLSTIGSRYS